MRPLSTALLLLTCIALAGCASDPVQDDLIHYINNEMPRVAALESRAMDAYNGVTGDNYQSDQMLYDTLTHTVIPNYKEFADQLEAVKPATRELQEIHEKWIAGANKQLVAFNIMLPAIEKQDPEAIQRANEKLAEGRAEIRSFNSLLEELEKAHNVVITPRE